MCVVWETLWEKLCGNSGPQKTKTNPHVTKISQLLVNCLVFKVDPVDKWGSSSLKSQCTTCQFVRLFGYSVCSISILEQETRIAVRADVGIRWGMGGTDQSCYWHVRQRITKTRFFFDCCNSLTVLPVTSVYIIALFALAKHILKLFWALFAWGV